VAAVGEEDDEEEDATDRVLIHVVEVAPAGNPAAFRGTRGKLRSTECRDTVGHIALRRVPSIFAYTERFYLGLQRIAPHPLRVALCGTGEN